MGRILTFVPNIFILFMALTILVAKVINIMQKVYRAGAGLGMWQIVVALIAGISAKEVVVSSFAVLFGVTNAYSLMIFCLLYGPCIAAVTTIKKNAVPGNLHLRR